MAIFSLFPLYSSVSALPPYHHHFLSLPSSSSSSYDTEFVADRRSVRVGLVLPSAHSNLKLLKTNRRSPYGEALNVHDSDEEVVVQDFGGVNGVVAGDDEDEDEDEEDGIRWFLDDVSFSSLNLIFTVWLYNFLLILASLSKFL